MLQESAKNRRSFLKTTGILASGMLLGASATRVSGATAAGNAIPKWKGFNLLDNFSPDPSRAREGTKEDFFKWMADWGFDFVRLPMAYPSYVKFDRSENISPNRVRKIDKQAVDQIDELIYKAHKYGLHVSLNLHRAPASV